MSRPKNRANTPPPPATEPSDDDADVGQSFTLELQRHAHKPLYRLREQSVTSDGTRVDRRTPWVPFSEWTPELLLARKRLQDFVFSGDPRMPRGVEESRRS